MSVTNHYKIQFYDKAKQSTEDTTIRRGAGYAARKIFAKFHIKTRIFVHSRGTFEVMLV